MNQQEIKQNLRRTPFVYAKGFAMVECKDGYEVANTKSENYTKIEDEATALAITHAINNTYGKGINPESVGDMYNALTIVAKDLTELKLYDAANTIQSILNKSKL